MSDIHALSGAYAVDALDDLERAGFERHLAICAACSDEVSSLREAASLLIEGAGTTPPPVLRERVLAEIATFRPLPPVVGPVVAPTVSAAIPLRGRRIPALAAAAAVVAVLGLGAAVTHPWQDPAPRGTVARVMSADDAQTRTFSMPGGARAVVVRSKQLNQAVLTVEGMTPPPSGEVYELWLQHGEHMVAAGFLPTGSGDSVLLSGDAATATAVGITTEPEGGSPEPDLASAVLLPFDEA